MDNNHLIKLLNVENRVILPDFGAFMIKQGPPRSVIFNEYLKFNDGLLIKYLMETENIDKAAAVQNIKDFIEKIGERINSDKPYLIEGIGILYKDPKGKIQFEQYKETQEPIIELVPDDIAAKAENIPEPEASKADEPATIKPEITQPLAKAGKPLPEQLIITPTEPPDRLIDIEKKPAISEIEEPAKVIEKVVPIIASDETNLSTDASTITEKQALPEIEKITQEKHVKSDESDSKLLFKEKEEKEALLESQIFTAHKKKKHSLAWLWILLGVGIPVLAIAVFVILNFNLVQNWLGLGRETSLFADSKAKTHQTVPSSEDKKVTKPKQEKKQKSIAPVSDTKKKETKKEKPVKEPDKTTETKQTADEKTTKPSVTENKDTKNEEKTNIIATKEDKAKDNSKPAETIVQRPASKGTGPYHVIVGCFDVKQMAENYLETLKGKGINNAYMWGNIGRLYAISIGSYPTRQEAYNALKQFNDKIDPDGWVYKK
ncbi:MAG: SPOR domain-containing protein [Bacteroidia bacterium]|nr:SPOR domain-containing protein [Bacteroidia bacterium]